MKTLFSLTSLLGLGLVAQAATPETFSYVDLVPTDSQTIPDFDFSGLVRTINVPVLPVASAYEISVTLKIDRSDAGTVLGDYYAYLYHADVNGARSVVLLNRVGTSTMYPAGYTDEAMNVTFRDDAVLGDIHRYRIALGGPSEPPLSGPLTGTWQPDGRSQSPFTVSYESSRIDTLGDFSSMSPWGDWSLFVSDVSFGGEGKLTQWSLNITPVPEPSAIQIFGLFAGLASAWALKRRKE